MTAWPRGPVPVGVIADRVAATARPLRTGRAVPGTAGYTPRVRCHAFYGGPGESSRCECGALPPEGERTRPAANAWHRRHKAAVLAGVRWAGT